MDVSHCLPLLKTNLKNKLQKVQNKYILFSLNLPPRFHINSKGNWLSANERVERCLLNEIFSEALEWTFTRIYS